MEGNAGKQVYKGCKGKKTYGKIFENIIFVMISNLSIILLQILLETKISVLAERKKNKHESLFGLHQNYIATRIALYGRVACIKKKMFCGQNRCNIVVHRRPFGHGLNGV